MAASETIGRFVESHEMEPDMSKQGSRNSITSVLAWVEAQLERRRSRRALLEMSDEQLKDIGISRGDAYREAKRTMWI